VAVNIYDELAALSARVTKLEAQLAPKTRLAPVTYFRPDKAGTDGSNSWDAVIAARPALALINPGNGPGPAASTSYPPLVAKAQTAGVPVYGYVYTEYGARPLAAVKADILNHISWYSVAGIFLDETSNKPEHVAYYADLCAFVHSKGRKVVLNTGTQCLEDHAKMADYVMCSEGDLATYKARVPRAWEAAYGPKLWHCVHSVPVAELPAVVALAKSRGAGLLFVTERTLAVGCYRALPEYWSQLCALVAP
jgi:hypothetical protein